MLEQQNVFVTDNFIRNEMVAEEMTMDEMDTEGMVGLVSGVTTDQFGLVSEMTIDELNTEDKLAYSSQKIVELDQQSIGRLSRMDALQSQAMAQAHKRRRAGMKEALHSALKRVEENEYGYCVSCGEEIGIERLIANPVIIKCIPCIKDC